MQADARVCVYVYVYVCVCVCYPESLPINPRIPPKRNALRNHR